MNRHTQDPNQRKVVAPRPRADDSSQLDSFSKRPSLFETHQGTRKSSIAREDIVLGPPKVAFSSSSNVRNLEKGVRPNEKTELHNGENDVEGMFGNRSRKFGGAEEKESDRNEHRYGNRRRGGLDDTEDWQTNRHRRRFDHDDNDRRPRRNGGDRWNTRDPRAHQGPDGEARPERDEEGRFTSRREGHGRSRFQQPWIRGDASESLQGEDGFRDKRPREWRKERGGVEQSQDPEWLQTTRAEEPEWLDSTGTEGAAAPKTQADFEKWMKERRHQSEKEPSTEPLTELHEKKAERPKLQAPADGGFFGTFGSPEAVNQNTNDFFGMFGEKPKAKATPVTTTDGKEKEKAGKTRFKSLFSPPSEVPNPNPEPQLEAVAQVQETPKPETPVQTSENADQEGFQRILQMLGGRSRNSTPQVGVQEHSQPATMGQQRPISASLISPSQDSFPTTVTPNPRNRNSSSLENSLPPGSPIGIPESARRTPQNQNSDILLRLMKQNKINDDHIMNAHSGSEGERSRIPSNPDIHHLPNLTNKGTGQRDVPSFFTDPAITSIQQHRQEQENAHITSEIPSRPQFDEGMMNTFLVNQPPGARLGQRAPPGAGPVQGQGQGPPLMSGGRPPGLPYPSGMQQPPGWPTQHQQHLPPQSQAMNAPPGIPTPLSRGMHQGPSFPPPMFNQGPPPPPPPQAQQQGNMFERQRKFTGNGAGPPPFPPPGMAPPPPGFMGNNISGGGGPTPGLLPGMTRVPEGGQGPAGPALMEMFAAAERERGVVSGRGNGGAGRTMPGAMYR
ncbi:MAG: hypothetical protein Q9227_002738 [Pyrenula ochraceoflavens]